ncbi:tripartite motif-containing protein 59 [Mobula hypostoma]|uniref:tripartite motif-containing protein 59 n=1 Tax=Mobula hypostoma TaxID=723540 RepID=UPI002FC3A523
MDNFEEDLTCSICYSIFEDPRVLPCSHTFCRSCLENIIRESRNLPPWRAQIPLKCPTCRSTVDLPPVGTGSLPINFSLVGIIDKYQKEEQSKTPNCPEHNQPLNMFCLLDRRLVCGYCLTVGQHQKHSVDDLQNAYIKEKEKASKLVDQLTDKHWAELSIFIEKLEHQKLQAEHIIQGEREIVIQYFQNLQKNIEAKKLALLAILHDVNLKITNEYGPVIQKMKELREEQHNLITFSTYVEEEEDPLLYLEKIQILRQKTSTLMKTELPVVHPLNIHPQAEQFLTEKWSKVTVGHITEAPILQAKHLLETQWNKCIAMYIKHTKVFAQRFVITVVLSSLILFITQISHIFKDYCVDAFNAAVFSFPQLNTLSDIILEIFARVCFLKATIQHSVQLLINFFAHITDFHFI